MRLANTPQIALVFGLAVVLLGSTQPVQAQETGFVKEFGTMWTFDAPPLDYWNATYDFRPDQAWLDHVRLSTARIPGCSSSFVSADGLLLTNHHCARRCISAASTPDSNYQETGFVARSFGEEKQCPGMYADQLQSIEDITDRIRNAVTASDPATQVQQRDSMMAQIRNECNESTGLNCQVVRFYQGGMYSLYRYKRFTDVRLVMAPEGQAAFFGGDPDNFTYPRYDLDMTLFRVYENNAPRQTDHFFTWSDYGAAEGDVVFVIGNPGSTGRLLTMSQMEYLRDVQYPAQLAGYERQLEVLRVVAARSEEDRRANENRIFGLENSHKAVSGYLTGLLDPTIMAKKKAFEADFRGRIAADPTLQAKYGAAWDAIAEVQQELAQIAAQRSFYGFGGSQLLGTAGLVVRLPEFQGERLDAIKSQLMRAGPFDVQAEQMTLTAQLHAAKAALPEGDPFLNAVLNGRTPEVVAEELISGTHLGDTEMRGSLVEGGPGAVAASDDPMIVLARTINPMRLEIGERVAALNATVAANTELVGQAIFAAYGKSLPPDATFTPRISDGVVKRYPMNGTVAPYKTTMYGLYARAEEFDHQDPWVLAPRWKERRDQLDLSTPLNFVSSNDIIGGNSGSPVINREAEVVGLIFDGNIEMLPNRFVFTDEISRSVSVHSAAIIEALRKIYDAERIADELQGVGR
ncbi:MAG: S46 family peptidase [Gemmatimonadota bacterium]|nr:MAG: S46 family peptidase [Gemmatimonadota bacterium]